jgi:hypothetical protein
MQNSKYDALVDSIIAHAEQAPAIAQRHGCVADINRAEATLRLLKLGRDIERAARHGGVKINIGDDASILARLEAVETALGLGKPDEGTHG